MLRACYLAGMILLLTGCRDDVSDIEAHTSTITASHKAEVEVSPATLQPEPPVYLANNRSPFALPQMPQAIQNVVVNTDCQQPDMLRPKEPLEHYPLGSLKLKAVLGEHGRMWAFIETADHALHRVTLASYLGLYHGKVTSTMATHIELLELIPDGAGCWTERIAMLHITEPVRNSRY